MSEREKYWIQFYNSNHKEIGYNLTSGGDGAALGLENVASKFTEEDLLKIISLLEETVIPMHLIAEEFECSRATIERINAGQTYYNKNNQYPLRKEKYKTYSGVKNGNSSLTQEQFENLVYDLKYTNILFSDLCTKYNVSQSVITNINRGITYFNSDMQYPLREKNASQRRVFSKEEMDTIKFLLQETKTPMAAIAKEVKCDSKVIAAINKGTRQTQSDWVYPLRK